MFVYTSLKILYSFLAKDTYHTLSRYR